MLVNRLAGDRISRGHATKINGERVMARISGGCSCGKVRYSADADPTFVAVCHCHACQKASGSALAVIVALPAASLTVTGGVATYDSTGASGKG